MAIQRARATRQDPMRDSMTLISRPSAYNSFDERQLFEDPEEVRDVSNLPRDTRWSRYPAGYDPNVHRQEDDDDRVEGVRPRAKHMSLDHMTPPPSVPSDSNYVSEDSMADVQEL